MSHTIAFLALAVLGATDVISGGASTPSALAADAPFAPAADAPQQEFQIEVVQIAEKKTLGTTLLDMGIAREEHQKVLLALKDVFDFRKSRPGDQVRLTRMNGKLECVEYRASHAEEWLVSRQGDELKGEKRSVQIEKKIATVDIVVNNSLYEAVIAAGEDSGLAAEIADVLAWDVDFYRDVRNGDKLRVIVEKQLARGKLAKYGNILGVLYEGAAAGRKKLVRYTTAAGQTGYFDERGNSARKPFLKSPLKYVLVTSRFGGRRHPLSGYFQNHQGVDFAAEIGTPIWSVSDGTISRIVSGDERAGNYIFVKHSNGFESGYLHLSRFASGMAIGAKVKQKQVIAYTGNTGSSTGPHLHYSLKQSGRFINPLTIKIPRTEPLPSKELSRFEKQTISISAMLNAEFVAIADDR